MIFRVLNYLKENEVEYKEDLSMARLSAIRLGGNAKITAFPNTAEKLISLSDFLKDNKIKHKIAGRMSNILPTDESFEGVLVRTDKLRGIFIQKNEITAFCGEGLPFVAMNAARASLSGFEELSGIPGSVGGALFGNAGAFGRDIGQLVLFANVYDSKEKRLLRLSKEELVFSYRESLLKGKDLLVLSVRFCLAEGECDLISKRIYEIKEKRSSTQPKEPSLGSVFKRQSDIASSKLIDLCGLKGRRIGGAEISKKHAGFIVNTGNASSEDYKALVNLASQTVYFRFGKTLEREVEYLC